MRLIITILLLFILDWIFGFVITILFKLCECTLFQVKMEEWKVLYINSEYNFVKNVL